MNTVLASADTPRRRNRRGEGVLLRDVLIDAATRIITDRGDAGGLSLRQVAAEAGVATTSIYAHFEDMDALLRAVAIRGLNAFSAARDRAVEGAASPEDALLRGCVSYVRFAVANPGLYRLMFAGGLRSTMSAWGDAEQKAGEDPAVAYTGLVTSIRRCQEAGTASAAESPELLAALVWPALHGIAMLRIDRPTLALPGIDELVHESVRRLVSLRTLR